MIHEEETIQKFFSMVGIFSILPLPSEGPQMEGRAISAALKAYDTSMNCNSRCLDFLYKARYNLVIKTR